MLCKVLSSGLGTVETEGKQLFLRTQMFVFLFVLHAFISKLF